MGFCGLLFGLLGLVKLEGMYQTLHSSVLPIPTDTADVFYYYDRISEYTKSTTSKFSGGDELSGE
jgi:hypothetical protein